MKVKVTQSCPTLCNPMDYTVHGTLQARVLEWVVAIPLLQGIFPIQGWNQGFPYCSQILYISMCVCIYIDRVQEYCEAYAQITDAGPKG